MRVMIRTALTALALTLLLAHPAAAGTGMFVGAAEDSAKQLDPMRAKSRMDLAALAGLGTVRMTLTWSPGEQRVGGDDRVVLQNVSAAAQIDGVRLLVSVYPRDWRTTPLTSRARGEFAEYTASVARAFPAITDFVIGNEPNLNLFWKPQFGLGGVDVAASRYELLLARTYDALKSVSADINVIGGALAPRGQDKANALRQTHSPTTFIKDLGAAYRKSKRHRPIMDMFAIHPYLIPSKLPPTFAHPNTTTIGIADYPKLVRLLTNAFRGTAQRGETLPIVYDEFGYQSVIPVKKKSRYTHLGSPTAKDAISEALQASYYRQAFELAACQPTVAGLLVFHVTDERDARAWQSGLYYSDNTPKSSMATVREAALDAQGGRLGHCRKAKTTTNLSRVVFHQPATELAVDFACVTVCSYDVQVIDSETGEKVAGEQAKIVGKHTVTLPTDNLPPGTYQYVVRALKSGKPGTAETRTSRPFPLIAPVDGSEPLDPPKVSRAPRLPAARTPLPTLMPTVPAAT